MSARGKITLLMFFFALCGTAALVNYRLAQNSQPPVVRPAELFAVVNGQLANFRDADFPGAYRHASSGIQQRFNLDQFSDMIRNEYSRIVRAQRVEFGFVESSGRHAVIQVFFIDAAGQVTPCIYTLVSEGEGWKIDGARVLRRWPASTRLGGIRS